MKFEDLPREIQYMVLFINAIIMVFVVMAKLKG